MKYTANSEKKCGEVVDLVFNRVIDGGLAEAVEEGPDTRAKRGRRVRRCRWKTWADIHGNTGSDAFRLRLGLGQDDFA